MSAFDLKEQLSFYGAYHSNKWNILIHCICVPLIMWSALVWLSGLEFASLNLSNGMSDAVKLNASLVFVMIYGGYYLSLEPQAGALATGILLFFWVTANIFFSNVAHPIALATGLHIFCWALQFIGHGAFERRSPALLDNLLQAIVLAPFFVLIEVLFHVGYKPELKKAVEAKVFEKIQTFKQQSAKKSS